jgi:hypothetical protein
LEDVVGAAVNLALPYMAFKTKRRCYAMFAAAPLAIIGFALFLGSNSNNVKYAATFLVTSGAVRQIVSSLLDCTPDKLQSNPIEAVVDPPPSFPSSQFPFGALCTGAASANASPDGARAAAIGTVVMIGNIGEPGLRTSAV